MHLRWNRRRSSTYAQKDSLGRVGTTHKQAGAVTRGRTVKQTRGGSRPVQEYRPYLCSIKATVYHWISKMQGALLIMISTNIWSLGQTNPMARIKEPLPSKYSAQLFVVEYQKKYSCYKYQKPERKDQKRGRGLP